MNVTFYGQSCLIVEAVGKTFLFNPLVRPNERARDLDVEAVLADHVADAVDRADRPGAFLNRF